MFDELQIAHLHYGFVLPPPPSGSLNPILSYEEMGTILKLLSMDRLTSGFQKSTIPYPVYAFLVALSELKNPASALWDLSEHNSFFLTRSRRLRALEVLNDELFVFEFDKRTTTVSWRLAVTTASDALFLCRLPEDMTEKDLAMCLLERGMRFHTLLPRGVVTPTPLPTVDVNLVPKGYVFTAKDFAEYERQRAVLFEDRRIARACLLRGGILWRLALQSLKFADAIEGPTTTVTEKNIGVCFQCDPVDLWDDDLSPSELQMICGVNLQFADLSNPVHAQLSWWPQDGTWKSMHCQTHWTQADEMMFISRWEEYRDGRAQPQKKGDWGKLLFTGQATQNLNQWVEGVSLDFIKSFKGTRRRR